MQTLSEIKPQYDALRAELAEIDVELAEAHEVPSPDPTIDTLNCRRTDVTASIAKLKADAGFRGMDDVRFGFRLRSGTPFTR